jgi:hypothetical protein
LFRSHWAFASLQNNTIHFTGCVTATDGSSHIEVRESYLANTPDIGDHAARILRSKGGNKCSKRSIHMDKPLVLSTKKLRFDQLERLVAAQCAVLDYDASILIFKLLTFLANPPIGCLAAKMRVRSFLANPVASWAEKANCLCG